MTLDFAILCQNLAIKPLLIFPNAPVNAPAKSIQDLEDAHYTLR